MLKSDFLIIGGGVIGISIARELRRRYPDTVVRLIEKESNLGEHASGRNSGVLHAGFYYTPNSLKARFTRDGNRALTEYCDEHNLEINKCGKLVVAQNESELSTLDELLHRGNKNDIELYEVSESEALKLEPRVKTFQRALFSPTTSSVNPKEVMCSLIADARAEGIQIDTSVQYQNHNKNIVRTNKGDYEATYIVNSAGLHADRIAQDYGFSRNYRILPFKGLYLYSDEPVGALKRHIYPVPDLRNPFLGVHFTVTTDGHAKIGPTALPAFWREQYEGFNRFNLKDMVEITCLQTSLLLKSNFEFRRLAKEEFSKRDKKNLVDLAGKLINGLEYENFVRWGKPGIRAQLIDLRTRKLEMDFVIEGDKHSMHVLNAVSPGWTCALPFAKYVCDKIEAEIA